MPLSRWKQTSPTHWETELGDLYAEIFPGASGGRPEAFEWAVYDGDREDGYAEGGADTAEAAAQAAEDYADMNPSSRMGSRTAANPYMPASNPYINDAPAEPGTPDGDLDGPPPTTLTNVQPPTTTKTQPDGTAAENTVSQTPKAAALWPIICRRCGRSTKVASVLTLPPCPVCKTSADLDLDAEDTVSDPDAGPVYPWDNTSASPRSGSRTAFGDPSLPFSPPVSLASPSDPMPEGDPEAIKSVRVPDGAPVYEQNALDTPVNASRKRAENVFAKEVLRMQAGGVALTVLRDLVRAGGGDRQVTIAGVPYLFYYDQKGSVGDFGDSVPGSITGDFEVFRGADAVGSKEVVRQHVSPTGQGSDTIGYAVGRVADAVADDVVRCWATTASRKQAAVFVYTDAFGYPARVVSGPYATWEEAVAAQPEGKEFFTGGAIGEDTRSETERSASRKQAQTATYLCGRCGNVWASGNKFALSCPSCNAEESVERIGYGDQVAAYASRKRADLNPPNALLWTQDQNGGFVSQTADGARAYVYPDGHAWVWQIVRAEVVLAAGVNATDEECRDDVKAYLSTNHSASRKTADLATARDPRTGYNFRLTDEGSLLTDGYPGGGWTPFDYTTVIDTVPLSDPDGPQSWLDGNARDIADDLELDIADQTWRLQHGGRRKHARLVTVTAPDLQVGDVLVADDGTTATITGFGQSDGDLMDVVCDDGVSYEFARDHQVQIQQPDAAQAQAAPAAVVPVAPVTAARRKCMVCSAPATWAIKRGDKTAAFACDAHVDSFPDATGVERVARRTAGFGWGNDWQEGKPREWGAPRTTGAGWWIHDGQGTPVDGPFDTQEEAVLALDGEDQVVEYLSMEGSHRMAVDVPDPAAWGQMSPEQRRDFMRNATPAERAQMFEAPAPASWRQQPGWREQGYEWNPGYSGPGGEARDQFYDDYYREPAGMDSYGARKTAVTWTDENGLYWIAEANGKTLQVYPSNEVFAWHVWTVGTMGDEQQSGTRGDRESAMRAAEAAAGLGVMGARKQAAGSWELRNNDIYVGGKHFGYVGAGFPVSEHVYAYDVTWSPEGFAADTLGRLERQWTGAGQSRVVSVSRNPSAQTPSPWYETFEQALSWLLSAAGVFRQDGLFGGGAYHQDNGSYLGRKQAEAEDYDDSIQYTEWYSPSRHPCPKCGAILQQRDESQGAAFSQFRCPQCGWSTEIYNMASRKVAQIVAAVRRTNPGVSVEQATKVAHKTIERYPAVVKSAGAPSENVCPKCGAKMSDVSVANGTLTARCAECGWSGTKRQSSRRTAAGGYQEALARYRASGASKADDAAMMAAFCEFDLQTLVGAVSPTLVWEGAQAKGLSTKDLAHLAKDPTAISELMW